MMIVEGLSLVFLFSQLQAGRSTLVIKQTCFESISMCQAPALLAHSRSIAFNALHSPNWYVTIKFLNRIILLIFLQTQRHHTITLRLRDQTTRTLVRESGEKDDDTTVKTYQYLCHLRKNVKPTGGIYQHHPPT